MPNRSKKGLILKEVEVKRGSKTFTRKQWVKTSKDDKIDPKSKKEVPKSKGSYKIGSIVNLNGKNLKIKKISESQETIKLSNNKIYTFEAINKILSMKKSESIDSIFKNRKLEISKSELSKAVNVSSESGEVGYAFIPQVYDNKKTEDSVVSKSSLWMKKVQRDLEKELKQFYGD